LKGIQIYNEKGLGKIKTILFILLSGSSLIDTGCIKNNSVSQSISAIKVIGDREDNNFCWFATDKTGNIYTVENQDKAISANDTLFVIKTNPALNVIWRKPVFQKGGLSGFSIMDIGDGLIINLGNNISTSSPPLIIARMDYNGNVKWLKTLPMQVAGSGAFGPHQSCCFMGTNASGAPFVCEIDSEGNINWTHAYPVVKSSPGPDQSCRFGNFTSDGDIVLCGYNFEVDLNGYIQQQAKIIKTDFLGNVLWQDSVPYNFIPGIISSVQFLTEAEAPDGHIVCTLGSTIDQQNYQTYAVIYDKDGKNRKIIDMNTQFYFSPVGNNGDEFNFYRTADNGYFIGGISKTSGTETHYQIFIAKFDVNFNKLWTKTYGGNYDLLSGGVKPYNDGGFLIGSTTAAFGMGKNGNDILLIRTDANGNLVK